MKKRFLALLLTLLLLLALLPVTASADMGPKASVSVSLKNSGGKQYYVTLLSARRSTGPYNFDAPDASFQLEGDTDGTILARFREYAEADDFYLLDYIRPCTDEFLWTYYPPDTFKVLICDPETDSFYVSDVLSQYAFTSSFTAELPTEGSTLTVTRSYHYLTDLLDCLFRCGVTLGVELLIALPFCLWRKKTIRVVLLLNVITQLLLNIGLSVYVYFSGNGFWMTIPYFFAELVVFAFEGYIYHCTFPEELKLRPLRTWGYALIANACSFLLGIFLYTH